MLCSPTTGYYPAGSAGTKTNQQAQIDMIDEVLAWAGVDKVTSVGVVAGGGVVPCDCGGGGGNDGGGCGCTSTTRVLHKVRDMICAATYTIVHRSHRWWMWAVV